jgi:hypothetical protein
MFARATKSLQEYLSKGASLGEKVQGNVICRANMTYVIILVYDLSRFFG